MDKFRPKLQIKLQIKVKVAEVQINGFIAKKNISATLAIPGDD